MDVLTSKSEQVTQGRVGVSEKEKQRFRIALTLVAMLLVSCMLISPNVKAVDEYYPGGWLIKDGTVTKSDVNLHVSGDLIIDSTGSLVFEKNVTLIIYSSTPGEYKIQVNASGEFHVLNKSIVKSDLEVNGYKFLVYGTLDVQNESTVKWMWGNGAGPEGGIQILSGGDATIEDSTITEGETHNVYVTGNAAPVIRNSNITHAGRNATAGGYGIFAIDTSAPVIENNNISNNDQYGVGITSTSSIEISHNEIWNNSNAGIEGNPNTLLNIHNNTIYQNSGDGIRLDGSHAGTKVRDNLIYSTNNPPEQDDYMRGLHVLHAIPTVEYNTFKDFTNWGSRAGGIVCIGASPLVRHNLFQHNARGMTMHQNATMKSSPIIEHNEFLNNYLGITYYDYSTTTSSEVRYNNFTVLSGALGMVLVNTFQNSPKIHHNSMVGEYYPNRPPNDEVREGIRNINASPWIYSNTLTNLNRTITITFNSPTVSYPTIQSNTIVGDASTQSIGIRNYQASPSISGNMIRNNSFAGIYFEGTSISTPTSSVSVNTIEFNKYGVYMYSSSPSLINNTIKNNWKGVYADQYSNSTMSTNTIKDNTYVGVDIRNSSSPSVMNNDILRNHWGVFAWYNSDATINGNDIEKNTGGGISVIQSSPTIQSNDILDNNGTGIDCHYGNPSVKYNTIKNNEYAGIILDHCNPEIGHNTVSDTRMQGGYSWVGMGIFASNQSSPNIHNNTVKDNLGDGVYVSDINNASHPSIKDNTFENNSKWAIHMRWTCAAQNDSALNSSNTFLGNQGQGRILQEWYLVVHVTYKGNSEAEAYVNITESPYTGDPVWTGQTGQDGKTVKITLKEYYYDLSGKKYSLTPHRVHAEKIIDEVLREGLQHPTMNHNYDDYEVKLYPED